jgi:ribosomal protein S18 acetylase RimI-like enzyme
MRIRPFERQDTESVIALWERCGLIRPWNDSRKDIERKLTVQPELFLVGLLEGEIAATVMAGYEGHRGWINYLAVDPDHRRSGLGRELMAEAERLLLALGCPKVSLQVRRSNKQAFDFYLALGFAEDDVVSFGKRIIRDDE